MLAGDLFGGVELRCFERILDSAEPIRIRRRWAVRQTREGWKVNASAQCVVVCDRKETCWRLDRALFSTNGCVVYHFVPADDARHAGGGGEVPAEEPACLLFEMWAVASFDGALAFPSALTAVTA